MIKVTGSLTAEASNRAPAEPSQLSQGELRPAARCAVGCLDRQHDHAEEDENAECAGRRVADPSDGCTDEAARDHDGRQSNQSDRLTGTRRDAPEQPAHLITRPGPRPDA